MQKLVRSRRIVVTGLLGVGAALALPVRRAGAEEVVRMVKSPTCGCCGLWADHLRAEGFACEVQELDDLTPLKDRLGIPEELRSCHTATLAGYVVEGHVPAIALRRLLAERPAIAGLAVPGMPSGAPGMPSPEPEAYAVVAFARDGQRRTFMRFFGEQAI